MKKLLPAKSCTWKYPSGKNDQTCTLPMDIRFAGQVVGQSVYDPEGECWDAVIRVQLQDEVFVVEATGHQHRTYAARRVADRFFATAISNGWEHL